MVGQDDEMDDLVNELAALEVDPLKRSAANDACVSSMRLALPRSEARAFACFGFSKRFFSF
jgi:hypothetical protein